MPLFNLIKDDLPSRSLEEFARIEPMEVKFIEIRPESKTKENVLTEDKSKNREKVNQKNVLATRTIPYQTTHNFIIAFPLLTSYEDTIQ